MYTSLLILIPGHVRPPALTLMFIVPDESPDAQVAVAMQLTDTLIAVLIQGAVVVTILASAILMGSE